MKQVVKNYTFNTSTRVITLTDLTSVSLDRLALIVNTTTNKILWNLADATVATATVSTNAITLSALPGGDNNADKLAIFYDAQPTDGAVFTDGQTPTSSAFLSVSFSTTTAQAVATTDAGLYSWVSVHLTSSGTSSTVTFQASNDNSNWTNAPLLQSTSTNGVVATTATSAFLFHGPLPGRYFRLNVTGISAGTTAGVVTFFANAHTLPTSGVTVAALPTGSNTIGAISSIGTSVTPGTAAANLGKAEDAAHASGDTGVMTLAVRRDTPVHGTSTDGDYATINVGASGEQWVGIVGHNSTAEITVASTGLTTATTAYVAGDVLGAEMSFTNAVRTSGGRAAIEGAVLVDKAAVIGAVDLFLFRAASTPAADNAANSWADADMLNCVGVVSFPGPYPSALNRVAMWQGAQPFGCAATTLFGVLVTRSDHTFFGAAGDLQVKLFVRYE